MIITIGRCKLIKYLLLIIAIFKIIREKSSFSKIFYDVRNLLMQYLFICFTKFANVIFWFLVMKKIEFPKKKVIPKKEENFGIIKETKEITNIEKEEKIYRITTRGLSQKEINLYEKEKILKKRYYNEIKYLIISSILDFIANVFYLFSLPIIANDIPEEYRTNTTNSINNEENYIINNTSSDNVTNEYKNDNLVNLIPFRILFRISLFYLFFELFLHFEKIHRHQFISLLSIIIISILAYFEYFKDILEQDNYFLFHLPICFFQELSFCLYNAIGAKYLSISNGNVYKLLFFNGLFGIVMILIMNFCLTKVIFCSQLKIDEHFCKNKKLRYFYDFEPLEKYKYYEYINIGFTFIMSVVEMASMWLLILYQTVNHLSVACAIHLFFRFLIGKKELADNHYIIGITCFVFIIFFTLVFNEIIILRFCTLDKNTKEEIEKRAIDDKALGEILSVGDSSNEATINDN